MWGSGIWQEIVKYKYLKACGLEHIYKDTNINLSRGSLIWQSFQKVWECWHFGMVWGFGNGHKIMIGSDPIMGVAFGNILGEQTLSIIHCEGFFYLSQIIHKCETGCPVWKNAEELHLAGSCTMEELSSAGPCFDRGGESLHWFGRLSKGAPIVADTYKWLMALKDTQWERPWFARIWKWKIPTDYPICLAGLEK